MNPNPHISIQKDLRTKRPTEVPRVKSLEFFLYLLSFLAEFLHFLLNNKYSDTKQRWSKNLNYNLIK